MEERKIIRRVAAIALEHRFKGTPDSRVWTETIYSYDFWKEYLEIFDEIKIIARVEGVKQVPEKSNRCDGLRINFLQVPYYEGFGQFLRRVISIMRMIWQSIDEDTAYILRLPGTIGTILWALLKIRGIPYAIIVSGDPEIVFQRGNVTHPLRLLFKVFFASILKIQCGNASACLYVNDILRYKYRCKNFSKVVSDVYLHESDYISIPRVYDIKERHKIVFVGSLDQRYKGVDVLLDAMADCVQAGHNLELTVIGDGRMKAALYEQTVNRGLIKRVNYLGTIPYGTALWEELDKADLFVLPSRTEGLPRAMIEAMARGLPCIGSIVGGIPELLAEEDLVPPDDAGALRKKICEVLDKPERMNKMSQRNLERAREYSDRFLRDERIDFLSQVIREIG